MKKQMLIAGVVILVALFFGGIAFAANASFEERVTIVNEKVEAGELSQEAADSYLKALQARVDECDGICDGTGADEERERLGQKFGIGFAYGNGNGEGSGSMNGQRGGNGSDICKKAD